jgi:Zn-dependent protease
MHGWVAHRHGDDTAASEGRLTFNPVPHVDPVGTLLVPALCHLGGAPLFGWARPVPVDPYRLADPRRDGMRVALAGPLANLGLAFLAAAAFRLVAEASFLGLSTALALARALQFAIVTNLYLAFFNLIPIHPLDGSKVAAGLLPARWLPIYERHVPFSVALLIVLALTGVLGWFVRPGVAAFYAIFRLMGLLA